MPLYLAGYLSEVQLRNDECLGIGKPGQQGLGERPDQFQPEMADVITAGIMEDLLNRP